MEFGLENRRPADREQDRPSVSPDGQRPRRRRVNNFGSGENMEDLISELPDDILVSIIARIPTKDALSTSILSKRWRYLLRFVPAFNFSPRINSIYTFPVKASIEGLYGVLQRHCAFIRSFKFRCYLNEPYTRTFEQCIHLLGELGIEKLSLNHLNKQFYFSCHLLSQMPSLEHLTLRRCSLQPTLKIPCYSLKTLKLSGVKVPPGSLECVFSTCVSLCSFTIKKCNLPSKLCIRGPNLQLKCIAIHGCVGLEEMELFASNLTTLEYSCPRFVAFMFDYVPLLQSLYLKSNKAVRYASERLGKDLPHLKTLVLDCPVQSYEHDLGINTFKLNNLKRLELSTMRSLPMFNLFCVTTLLDGCPLLEDFHLAVTFRRYYWMGEEKDVVLHSHLKNVELNGFVGTKPEIEFASYILRRAVKLQLMNISWHYCMYLGFGEWDEYPHSPLVFGDYPFSKANESIEQLKQEAISKTAQVTLQKFPPRVPKQF